MTRPPMSNSPTEPMARPMTVNDELLGALKEALPSNLCVTNPVVSDSVVVSLDTTMGDLRKIAAAIARAESPALTEGVEAVAWRARYAVGKNVDTWSLHETEPKWLTSDGSGDYEVQPLYATPLQTGARGGLGSSADADTQPATDGPVVGDETIALRKALRNLTDACLKADAMEELSEWVDGSLLDAAEAALDLQFPVIWTPEQVAMLEARQAAPMSHPYTCGGNRSDALHKAQAEEDGDGDAGILIPTPRGWVCPACDYRQFWSNETGGPAAPDTASPASQPGTERSEVNQSASQQEQARHPVTPAGEEP